MCEDFVRERGVEAEAGRQEGRQWGEGMGRREGEGFETERDEERLIEKMKLFSFVLLFFPLHQVNMYSSCRLQPKHFFKEASLCTPNLDLVLLWHFLYFFFPFEGCNRLKSDFFL